MVDIQQNIRRSKNLLAIMIPILIVAIFVGAVVYVAYRAEREGLDVGPSKYYVTAAEEELAKAQKRKQQEAERWALDKKEEYRKLADDSSGKTEMRETAGTGGRQKGSSQEAEDISAGQVLKGPVSSQPASKAAGGMDTYQAGAPAPDMQKKSPSGAYGFSAIQETFKPSTMAIIEDKETVAGQNADTAGKSTEDKRMRVKISGDLAREMFIFGVYNDIEDGRLVSNGLFRFAPKGRRLGEKIDINFIFSPDSGAKDMQLPVILNGEVIPAQGRGGVFSIDRQGRFRLHKEVSLPLEVGYSIYRRNKNCGLSVTQPYSRWLEKEFYKMPQGIKDFLDIAQGNSDYYRMVFVSAALNRCFGYQNDIISVDLPEGMTWSEYLRQMLELKDRMLCDCDVLSTYAFIFLKYMGFPAAVVVGYNNQDKEGLDRLSDDEHHAAVLVKVDKEWVLFDPTEIVPDMTREALRSSLGEVSYIQDQADGSQETEAAITGTGAKRIIIPARMAGLLGSIIFSDEIKAAQMNQSGLVRFGLGTPGYRHHRAGFLWGSQEPGLNRILAMVSMFSVGVFMVSMLVCFLLGRYITRSDGAGLSTMTSHWQSIAAKALMAVVLLLFIVQRSGFIFAGYSNPEWVRIIGAIFILLGASFAVTAGVLSIRDRFKGIASLSEPWKRRRINRLSRNPEYAGYFGLMIGTCLYAPNPVSVVCCVLAIFLYHRVIVIKEKVFSEKFGRQWRDYKSEVRMYL